MANINSALRTKMVNGDITYTEINNLRQSDSESLLLTGLAAVYDAFNSSNDHIINGTLGRLKNTKNELLGSANSNVNLATVMTRAARNLTSSNTTTANNAATLLKMIAAIGIKALAENATKSSELTNKLTERNSLTNEKYGLISDKTNIENLLDDKTNINDKIHDIDAIQCVKKNYLIDYVNDRYNKEIPHIDDNRSIESILNQNNIHPINVRDAVEADISSVRSDVDDDTVSITRVRNEIASFDENNTSESINWKVPALIMALN